MELVGSREIAERLGLTQSRVNQFVQTHEEFPDPVATTSGSRRVWDWNDVERWARATGRLESASDG